MGFACFFNSSTTIATAFSIPFLRIIGFAPAVTCFIPEAVITNAKSVAVVVPSPATSLVLSAASFTNWAPIFSNGSLSSISFATVTPSCTIFGAPHFLSKATFLPLGPNVVITALATISIPFKRDTLASSENLSCLAIFI